MDLNKLAKEAHEAAKSKGFYEVEPTLEQSILLILSEVSEALEADRINNHAYMIEFDICINDGDKNFKKLFEWNIKNSFEDELADVVIRLLDFAGFINYNLRELVCFFTIEVLTDKFKFLFELSKLILGVNKFDTTLNYCIANILEYCNLNNIDIHKHIELKMKYNAMRERKNGKQY